MAEYVSLYDFLAEERQKGIKRQTFLSPEMLALLPSLHEVMGGKIFSTDTLEEARQTQRIQDILHRYLTINKVIADIRREYGLNNTTDRPIIRMIKLLDAQGIRPPVSEIVSHLRAANVLNPRRLRYGLHEFPLEDTQEGNKVK